MRKVTIKIEGKEYDIELDEAFALALEEELKENLPPNANNSIKSLLQAYLKKCYDCYLLEKKLQNILQKL